MLWVFTNSDMYALSSSTHSPHHAITSATHTLRSVRLLILNCFLASICLLTIVGCTVSIMIMLRTLLSVVIVVLSSVCLLPTFAEATAAAARTAPLTVHLVCHSHDDVGWQVTVDEYYRDEVRDIINTVVTSLDKDPARKFMYVEQAFFQRWWREQNETRRALAQRLVATKQLEFVNGGWSMHVSQTAAQQDTIQYAANTANAAGCATHLLPFTSPFVVLSDHCNIGRGVDSLCGHG